MQVRGGRVIGEINGEEKMYPASMTKIMTTIVAIENLKDLDQEITLTNEMFEGLYEQDATQAGFQPGETVRAIDLLYGVMLPSGAECCIALADTIAGSEADFVTLMNEKAAKLGMTGTNFCDTTGLHDANHYSTARDIAVLLKYALKDDTFREIIESPYHSTPGTNIHPDGILSTVPCLRICLIRQLQMERSWEERPVIPEKQDIVLRALQKSTVQNIFWLPVEHQEPEFHI